MIEPEPDVWMWGSDNALRLVLRPRFEQSIREWLRERGFELTADRKPVRPKEAMEYLMREIRRSRSSSAYQEIAARISLNGCSDPAFLRLRHTLRTWFVA